MAGVQVLEAQVKVKALEMVQVAEKMKAARCFLDVLTQMDLRKLKCLEMFQESEMNLIHVPCFLPLHLLYALIAALLCKCSPRTFSWTFLLISETLTGT